jgi:hypothetical protein
VELLGRSLEIGFQNARKPRSFLRGFLHDDRDEEMISRGASSDPKTGRPPTDQSPRQAFRDDAHVPFLADLAATYSSKP